MKPLHAGLLIVGAALAGGLAVKMTGPQPLPVAPTPAAAPVNRPAAAPVNRMLSPVSPAAAAAPAPVNPAPKRPSPFPDKVAPAPAPIYLAPEKADPEKPAVRKNKPILTAKAKPYLPPFLPPVPYRPQAAPAARPRPEPQPAPQVPAPPAPRQATLPAGMTVSIRMNEPLSSERGVAGNTFDALLADPLVVDGLVIAERGCPCHRARRRSREGYPVRRIVIAGTRADKPDYGGWPEAGDSNRVLDEARRSVIRRKPGRRIGRGECFRHARKSGERSRTHDHPVPPGDANDDHRAPSVINCRDSAARCSW